MSTPASPAISETAGAAAPPSATKRRKMPARTIVMYVVLTITALIYLYPFVIQVATSFKTDAEASAHPLALIPSPISFLQWKTIFGSGDSSLPITRWLGNSVLVTVCVTAGRVFFDSLAGYALSRLQFRGRKALFSALLAVMSVPGVALLIPKFLMVKYLGIYDTYSAMILPLIVDAAGVFIMKQFFDTVPVSIEEAARMDGASTFQTFWYVVLPMARPALITLTILSFQGSWNEFSHFLVTTSSPEHKTLVTGLADLTAGGLGSGTQYPLKMATALITTIPVAILFFVFQKHLVRGANDGAVKG